MKDLDGAFGLVVRFTVKAGREQDFDTLVAETVRQIHEHEPGTLLYASHQVDGAPNVRIFYEVYKDPAAFKAHESQPHVRHFLGQRDALLDDVTVDFVTPMVHAGGDR